jgi:hypothetical protein
MTVAVRLVLSRICPQAARDWNIDPTTGLALLQTNPLPVISRPRQRQQVALPLTGFQRD